MPRIRDISLALAVCLLDVAFFSTAGADLNEAGGGSSALRLLGCSALISLPLVWRRRSPLTVFGTVWLLTTVGVALVDGYQPVLGILVALYTVGTAQPRSRAWLIGVAALPFAVVAANAAWLKHSWTILVGFTGFFGLLCAGVWALGHLTGRSRRRLTEAERRRAEAVTAERERISRELHDIVAHSVTVMVLQAAGAQRILHTSPDRAGAALAQIEESGRQAISELRRMLAAQRRDATGENSGEPAPQPGLADLDELLDRMRRAGVPVRLRVEGQPRQVDPSVELAAYRTVQEALTNTAKHAGAGVSTLVRLVWADELTVEVTDAGAATAAAPKTSRDLSTGNGLLGLRERIAIAGGSLTAGRQETGYEVKALLPLARR